MRTRIPYAAPSITELEVSYVTDAIANGWGERCYEYIKRFEDSLADHLGLQAAVATSSATGALHLGLAALQIGRDDEVILADSNWIATAAPIVHLGARPIFVDVLEDTWCIDPMQAEKAISPRTKAIIATHLYGNLCEMNDLLVLGRQYGIPVIEDAAEAIGSVFEGTPAGALGHFSVFSFHGTKTLTTGEGGAIASNDPVLLDNVLTLNNHGRHHGERRQFWPERVGFKFKMSNVQAALGYAQLLRIDELVDRKREIHRYYRECLAQIPDLQLNIDRAGCKSGAWMTNVVFPVGFGVTRQHLLNNFAKKGIDARVFFWPLSSLPFFSSDHSTPVAHSLAERSINLPSFHSITTDEQDEVVDVILETVSQHI